MLKRIVMAGVGGVAVVVLAAGCTATVAQADIQKEVANQTGATNVSCPGDLDATVGKSEDCTGTLNGSQQSFTATIATVNGNKVTLSVTPAGGSSTSDTTTGDTSNTTTGDTTNPTDSGGSSSTTASLSS